MERDRPPLPPRFSRIALRSPTLPPATHTNCYLVGYEQAILVDPGSPYPAEMDRVLEFAWRQRGSGGVIQAVLITHQHPDHAAAAPALAEELGVPLAAHPLTLAKLPLRPGGRQLPLEEGHRFRLDRGLELEVLHTPGHTAGHLCLFEPRARTLIAGDLVAGRGTTIVYPPQGEMAAYLASLERLRELAPAVILPGHGPALTDGAAVLERLIQHRRWREQRVIEALSTEGAQPCAAIARRAYDLEARRALRIASPGLEHLGLRLLSRWALACHTTLAHLIKLEHDGRAVRVGPDAWQRSAPSSGPRA